MKRSGQESRVGGTGSSRQYSGSMLAPAGWEEGVGDHSALGRFLDIIPFHKATREEAFGQVPLEHGMVKNSANIMICSMLELQQRHVTIRPGRGDRRVPLANAMCSPREKDLKAWGAAKVSR